METLRQNQIGRAQPETKRQAGRLRPVPVQEDKTGFYLVLASLLFEFGRPQDIIPGLSLIPFATGLDALILFSVLTSGKLSLTRLQTRLWIPLFFVMAIHVPLAMNNFWALMILKDMVLTFSLYLGIITYVNTKEKMMTVMKVWMGVHTVSAIIGITKGGTGVGGWMGDENDFCMVMNMVIPFAYFAMFSSRGLWGRVRYAALLGLFVLAAMTTLSRGGFFGLAAAGAYCWYRSPKKFKALLVGMLLVAFMFAFAPDKYWDEIASSTSDETMSTGTGGERIYTWTIGFEMFLYNPIIGVGQGNFPWTFEIYEEGRRFHEKSIAGRQAHSLYFTLLPELGLFGVFVVGGMVWRNFKDLKYVRKKFAPVQANPRHGVVSSVDDDIRVFWARAMEGSLIGYLVSGVFISILWYPSLWILTALVVALRNIADNETEQPAAPVPDRRVRSHIPLPKLSPKPARIVS